jgi:predicted ATPase/class 3 adenylate cyclase
VSTGGPPSGVVTFPFTDIEGSTRRWESDADAMRAALATHDELLRNTIEAHDGFLFKHTGDGVCAAFASPKSAVDAAVTVQRALELPVRMGIATGEAELRDGDYFGAVLNRAARVMAAGHGGQILVVDSTAVLVSGVDLLDLGPRRLRDVSAPVGVFQVQAAGLRTDFPQLRTVDASPGNLRPAPSRFIGRESELAEVEAVVRAHRLVTLTGTGGVGKTRLALEVAAHLVDEYPDGVWLFELAAVGDTAAVPDAVAAVLGITQQPGKTVNESVAAALEGRVRLLVFDNCEHVRDTAADLIEAILARSATVRILATSREGLGVADEQVWLVPSLDVAAGVDSAAVSLFVERARSVSSHFSMDRPDDAAAVVEICRRVDGIPLAIELAASRMASMTVTEVRDRLDHRFRLLVGSRRALERHQTLRHAVQWSYDLLTDEEKALLERCSVFAGGFELESACAVVGFDDDFAALDLLDALVRKSLLVADRSSGRTRYSMLETIRQFAEEQLAARGEASEARTAHARYFAKRVVDVQTLWESPRQRESYDWFVTELANLRNAFRWSADQDDLDAAAAIAAQAGFFGVLIENYEPITWAEELIAPARAVDHPRLVSLCAIASLAFVFGRVDDALRYSDAGQSAMQRRTDEVPFGPEQLWLGAVYSAIGQIERYVEFYRDILQGGDNPHELTRSCVVTALTNAGRPEEALSAATGLIDAAEETHNPFAVSFALLAYGMACSIDYPLRALDALRRGLRIAQESGNRTNESYFAMTLAMTLDRMEVEPGASAAALDNITLAIRNTYDAGNITLIRTALGLLATFLGRRDHHHSAAVVAGFARSMPSAAPTVPEFGATISDLCDVLGAQTFESLARRGEAMTMAAAVAYAYDQIDQARAELKRCLETDHIRDS